MELSTEEECQLIVQARAGDDQAFRKILDAHMSVIRLAVRALDKRGVTNFVPADDLLQAGCLGLLDAVKRFDARGGACFKAYATKRIKGAMIDMMREDAPVSRSSVKMVRTAERTRVRLSQELLREPTLVEWKQALPAEMQEHFEEIRTFWLDHNPQSLTQRNDEGEELTLDTLVAGNDGMSVEDEVVMEEEEDISKDFSAVITRALMRLDPRLREIVSLRYLASGEEVLTLAEVGRRFGVSESRVCQLETQALRVLRRYLRTCFQDEVVAELGKIARL